MSALLNYQHLVIVNLPHKICEVELYHYSNNHPDPYVHCHLDQLNYGSVYVHPKGGTFKGIDLTFGQEGEYVGLLVRTIQDISGNTITGPSKVVDYIMECLLIESVKELREKCIALNIFQKNSYLYLEPVIPVYTDKIYHGPRVGLSEKDPYYRNLPYRFVSQRALKDIKKQ